MGKKDDLFWTGDIVKVLHDDMHVYARITKMKGKKFEGQLMDCKQPFMIEFEKWQIKDYYDAEIYGDYYKYMYGECQTQVTQTQ